MAAYGSWCGNSKKEYQTTKAAKAHELMCLGHFCVLKGVSMKSDFFKLPLSPVKASRIVESHG